MTQTVEDFLSHHGVKGMKWGVRKNYRSTRNDTLGEVSLKTEKGVSVTLRQKKNGRVASAVAAVLPCYRQMLRDYKNFDISVGGKKVGEASVHEKSKDELYLMWMGVDKRHRGQGYASSVFDAGVAYAKSKGYKKLTLEVPGFAHDARHIYEKRGFKVSGSTIGSSKDFWGGLIPMQLELSKSEVRHASTDVTPDEMEQALVQHMATLKIDDIVFPTDSKGSEMAQAMSLEQFLAHHGVKGMKWGVRKNRGGSVEVSAKGKKLKVHGGGGFPAHEDALKIAELSAKAKKSGSHALSTAELKKLNERLQMEQQYSKLTNSNGPSPHAKLIKRGGKLAGDVVEGIARQQLTKIGNDYASQQIAVMMAAKKKK